jgi:hypothetical protein
MLGNRKLIVESHSEVSEILRNVLDDEFWNFAEHEPVKDAIYLIGRRQFLENLAKIRYLIETDFCRIILSNPAEGSSTMRDQVNYVMKLEDLAANKKLLIIGGGDMDNSFGCLQYDSFLAKILQFPENKSAQTCTQEIFDRTQKPYKFLFLNGRMRPHRKYLIESFALSGLLDQSLWSLLDKRDSGNRYIRLIHDGQDLMYTVRPIKLLPKKYEFDLYQHRIDLPIPEDQGSFVKNHLFDNEWGDIYIKPEQYIDTYFSLVTETVFDYPYSFRTEKIWKPIAIGHPWIAAANYGYYRDLRNLGFKTFNHVIDESFDQIENNTDRLKRIVTVVEDLCRQDLGKFLIECEETCKYNQQHLNVMRYQVAEEFPQRLFNFIREHGFDE